MKPLNLTGDQRHCTKSTQEGLDRKGAPQPLPHAKASPDGVPIVIQLFGRPDLRFQERVTLVMPAQFDFHYLDALSS